MNLAIGAPSDKPNTNEETFYLPDNMRIAFNNATNGGKPVVANTQQLFQSYRPNPEKPTFITPNLIFGLLLIIGLIISFFQFKNNSFNTLFDKALFISTGLLGILIVFLWFFTSHGVTQYNWNLLWALPTNLILAFLFKRERQSN